MKERIAQLLHEEGLTASKFAEVVGVQPSGISHILSGRNKPGYDLIVRIISCFPYIDPDWLLLGVGDMYRAGSVKHTLASAEPTLFDAPATHTEERITEAGAGLGFAFERPVQGEEPVTLSQVPDLFSNTRETDAEIERVMIFYSDNTVSTYKLKK